MIVTGLPILESKKSFYTEKLAGNLLSVEEKRLN